MMDLTMLIQLINTLVLLGVIIGLPLLVIKLYKNSVRRTKAIEALNDKVEVLTKKIDAM